MSKNEFRFWQKNGIERICGCQSPKLLIPKPHFLSCFHAKACYIHVKNDFIHVKRMNLLMPKPEFFHASPIFIHVKAPPAIWLAWIHLSRGLVSSLQHRYSPHFPIWSHLSSPPNERFHLPYKDTKNFWNHQIFHAENAAILLTERDFSLSPGF